MQLQPVSADLLDKLLRVEDDWREREWQVGEGVGGGEGGQREDKSTV